jgi:DeoR/GlpR family transcriptional regulator of sugar metabolism
MLIPARRTRLKEVIASHGMASLEMLSAQLEVSTSTVRRDLEELERQGLVKRTHGGAIWTGGEEKPGSAARPYAFDARVGFEAGAKQRIAKAARELVQPGQTILIDGGTTTYYLASELVGTPLQLVTNSLPIADLFINDERVELILTGGVMYPRYGVMLGPTAEVVLGTIHTKTLFLSVAGLNDGQLFNQNLLLVSAERKMMAQAQETVLLIDSTKLGQQALVRLCGLDEVDVIVTDAPPPEPFAKQIGEAGCRLIVAG